MKQNRERIIRAAVIAVGVTLIGIILLHAWNKLRKPSEDSAGTTGGSIQAEAADGIWIEEEKLETNKDMTLSLKEAVLGKSQQQKKLVVFEQHLSDIIKVTDQGSLPFNLSKKYQYVKYSGTASYSVDLSGIDEDSLLVDEEARTITIYIPHTEKQLDINEEETQADETEKVGIFSIGDLKLTEEERAEVIADVKKNMEDKLADENVKEIADRMAVMSVWEIYQPVVTGVSPEFAVVVEFL